MPLFQILADLHLETHPSYGHYRLPLTDAPYIALLGDIGHIGDSGLFTFLRELTKHYWAVFFLLGNHEPYQISMAAAKSRVRAFEKEMRAMHSETNVGQFVFLDQTRYDIDSETTVLGRTLYTSVPESARRAVGSRMVDFKDTRGWTVEAHNAAHESDLAWLNTQVADLAAREPSRKVVIFTHHSPTTDPRANDPRHKGSEMNAGFVTDLSAEPCWTSPNVRMWAFGHTHYPCDFVDEATGKKVLTNPKGYWRDPRVSGLGMPRRIKSSPERRFNAKLMYDLPSGTTIEPDASAPQDGDDIAESEGHERKDTEGRHSVSRWKRITGRLGFGK